MNLPNKLTIFRIILIPVFLLLMALHTYLVPDASQVMSTYRWWATVIFIVAAFTDWLDGYIARRDNIVTNFGKFADPLADKMLVAAAMICLVELQLAPAWVVSLIIARELAVTGLRLLLVKEGEVMAAAWPGKIKTTAQMLAIILLLANDTFFGFLPFSLGTVLLYISLFFTIYSGADYFYKNRHVFKEI